MTTRRMSAYDRVFLGYEVTKVVGPFVQITPAGLRAALAALHRADPAHPAVCAVQAAPARWRAFDAAGFAARLPSLVVDLGDPPPGAARGSADASPRDGGPTRAHAAIDALTEYAHGAIALGDRPLVFAVHDGYVVAKFAHPLGSGAYLNRLIAGLMRAAATGQPPALPEVRQDRFLVSRAVLRHFGRHPGNVVRMLRVPRPAATTPPATRTVEDWRASLTTRSDRSSAVTAKEVRAWRDRYAPDVSLASIVFAGLWTAFERSGLSPDPGGVVLLVDGQRYLPKGTAAGPNFIIGQYLAPADPADPRSVHRTLHAAIASGRPLAAMAERLIRQPRDIDAGASATVPDPARPKLVLTHGKLDVFVDGLPWAVPGEQARHTNVSSVGAPDALSVATWEMDGALHLAASFHAAVYPPDAVERALRLFCTAPAALLAGSSGMPGAPAGAGA